MQCICAVLYCNLWLVLVLLYYSTLSCKTARLSGEKSYWTWNMFWFSLQFLSETFLIPRWIRRDVFINVCSSSRKVPLIRVAFNKTWNFSTDFRKKSNIKFHENPSRGTRVFHTEGQTDGRTGGKTWWSQQSFFETLWTCLKEFPVKSAYLNEIFNCIL
jgi:hypothetical protein